MQFVRFSPSNFQLLLADLLDLLKKVAGWGKSLVFNLMLMDKFISFIRETSIVYEVHLLFSKILGKLAVV